MKRNTKNKLVASVLIGFLFGSLLILPTHTTQAQPKSSTEITPTVFQDITWYKDSAIFATGEGYQHWLLAEKLNNAWQVVHAENIPSFYSKEEQNKRHELNESLTPTRLRVYQDTLYVLATNENVAISGISLNTAMMYCYDLKTLTYIDTISFSIEYRIHDFVLTNTEEIIVLTDEGLYTYKDNSMQLIKEIGASYHELHWMDETTVCIGSYARNRDPQNDLLQYEIDTQKLSTLYKGELPILDIAVAEDHKVYALVNNPETKLYQLYCYQDGTFSLYDPVQRLSRWTLVLLDQDNKTPITVSNYWSNPILYSKQGDSVIRKPMMFTQHNGITLQFPGCLHASAGETSVLVNKGICICEDVDPQGFSSLWEDTGLTIPYETCDDIVKINEKAYLVLNNNEFCVVDSNGYRFSETLSDAYSFWKIVKYKEALYIQDIDYRDNNFILKKINLDDCILDSSPVSDFPEGPITVYEDSLYIYNEETIIKGIIKDNTFIEQEVLPAPAVYWENFSCYKLFYNPVNKTFVLIDGVSKGFRATFLKYNEKKEAIPVGFIQYQYIAPPFRGNTGVYSLVLLDGHVSFITHERYGRLMQF